MSARTKSSSPEAPPVKRKRAPVKDPGGSPEARRIAAVILENWAGVRAPPAAASALGVSLPRYYQLEQRAVGALVAVCEPRPRGPGPNHEREIRSLQRQLATSRRDCARLQALLRTSQRTIGLPAVEPPAKPAPGKRRPKRPTVRALKLARSLAADSPGGSVGEGVEPTGESAVNGTTRVVGAAGGAEGDAP
ncbi:MAG: hypothetical protein JNK76_21800 [Planctomycetales bacterium]|nr:hypothetical protein [Planctomycetales bacterium]